MSLKPIKRHPALQNLSREHHDILVFVLRIKKGIAKNAEVSDLQAYSDWFWENYLKEHFRIEEESLFPFIKSFNDLKAEVLEQHQSIKLQFENKNKNIKNFEALQTSIKKLIRFEERVFFNQIQSEMEESKLNEFKNLHQKQQSCGVWKNKFWQ